MFPKIESIRFVGKDSRNNLDSISNRRKQRLTLTSTKDKLSPCLVAMTDFLAVLHILNGIKTFWAQCYQIFIMLR